MKVLVLKGSLQNVGFLMVPILLRGLRLRPRRPLDNVDVYTCVRLIVYVHPYYIVCIYLYVYVQMRMCTYLSYILALIFTYRHLVTKQGLGLGNIVIAGP